jgi:isoprenylcysteine carboxyl methyltransferase (ICMT) family protein YpbQ
VPASAPFFWLTLTGYIGFVLIILREIFVFFGTLRLNRIYPTSIYIVQAYIVVLVQQSIYGVWMDPNYLIMVAFVFSLLSIKSKEIINYSSSDSN